MSWITDLKELLFPRFCKVCGRRLMKSEQHLCLECLIHLPRTHYELRPENKLMQHFMEWPEVVRATAYFHYYKEEGREKYTGPSNFRNFSCLVQKFSGYWVLYV